MSYFTPEETSRFLESLDKRFASAFVFMVTPDDRLLIVKANYNQHWTLPGGIIDAGEMPIEAACREVIEEVGINLEPSRLDFRIVASWSSHDLGLSYSFMFEAHIDENELSQVVLQEDELESYELVSKDEILSGNRPYGASVRSWALGMRGYTEYRADGN